MFKSNNKKQFQLILSVSTVVVCLIGFLSFAFLAEHYVYQDTVEQVLADNKKIGETIVKIYQERFHNLDSVEENQLINKFQNTCDNFSLPNDGYLCFIRENGDLVAYPGGVSHRFNFNENKVTFRVIGEEAAHYFEQLKDFGSRHFEGYFENENNKAISEVIVTMPITEDFNILVHQNNNTIKKKASRHLPVFLGLGTLFSMVCGIVVFFLSRRIVNAYENQLEEKNQNLKTAVEEIQSQKEKISSSIRYAERIQQAVFPPANELDVLLQDYFLINKPKDVVSGDFYWIHQQGEDTYIAVGDCTGHGVPGAFMSLIANDLLDRIIKWKAVTDVGEVLCQLHNELKTTLHQDSSNRPDGMDMTIIRISPSTNQLFTAGAMNSLYLISEKGLEEVKGSKFPIGGSELKKERVYETQEFKLHNFEQVIMASDGFQDQFGGDGGRKFMKKNFKELLERTSKESTALQKETILNEFDTWTKHGEVAQLDDIMIMGLRLSHFQQQIES